MTLDEAKRAFEANFKTVVSRPSDRCDLDQVCSGGTVGAKDVLPALYSSEKAAILSWLHEATLQWRPKYAILTWITKPELLDFQITMADRHGRHRVVTPRFAVRAQYKQEMSNGEAKSSGPQ